MLSREELDAERAASRERQQRALRGVIGERADRPVMSSAERTLFPRTEARRCRRCGDHFRVRVKQGRPRELCPECR